MFSLAAATCHFCWKEPCLRAAKATLDWPGSSSNWGEHSCSLWHCMCKLTMKRHASACILPFCLKVEFGSQRSCGPSSFYHQHLPFCSQHSTDLLPRIGIWHSVQKHSLKLKSERYPPGRAICIDFTLQRLLFHTEVPESFHTKSWHDTSFLTYS